VSIVKARASFDIAKPRPPNIAPVPPNDMMTDVKKRRRKEKDEGKGTRRIQSEVMWSRQQRASVTCCGVTGMFRRTGRDS
jgi:hypothetical protein